ncbi:MAG TPA: hypothetical protein DCE80_08735 [Ignavibacteriales bacterium]|nr:hypothetical protein [Ignavibacteriales bacterium]
MNKKKISSILKWTLTIALIIFAFKKAGLFDEAGRGKFIETLKDVRIEFVVLSVLILFVLNLSSSIKWYMLLKSRDIKIELWRVYAFYNIGRFFNLILPTSLGGDVVRIYQLGKYTGKNHTAAASVIVERFTGMLTLMIMATIAVVLNLKLFAQAWLSIALMSGIVLISGLAWFIFDSNSVSLFQKIFGNKIKIINKIFAKVDKIRKPIFEFKSDRKAMLWAMINSVIFQLLAVVNVWLSSLAFGDELTFISLLVAVPVILFIMNIPFSIGGIGLMEFAYVFTLPLFGASASLALSTVLLIRAKSILDSVFGGVLSLALNKDKMMISELKKE